MKKKFLPFLLIGVGLAVLVFMLIHTGVISFDTYSANNQTIRQTAYVDELKNGCFYVWHNEKSKDISKDLNATVPEDGTVLPNVFFLCPSGDVNWDDDTFVKHTIWFTSDNDTDIPTVYPGDKLLYISANYVPYKGISWERFSDYGYTIGAANLIGDESGHYHITSSDGESFEGYLFNGSDAAELNKYAMVTDLFLDKVGGVAVRDSSISEGGTVLRLDKNRDYICEWYTGTYYQDFKMRANVHAFSSLESFTTYDYEFLHSNVVEISIPDWFKTGYYYVDGLGFFRFVADDAVSLYNGKAYDANVYWNDPIILYDEYDNVIFDPSTGVDKTNEGLNSQSVSNSGGSSGSNIRQTDSSVYQNSGYSNDAGYDYNSGTSYYDMPVEDNSDSGAGDYETFYGVKDTEIP